MSIIQPQVTGRAAFSIEEVKAQTGLCRDSIYRAIRENKLVARKYGKRTVVLAADLQRFLEALPTIGKAAA
jgi:excisionase family DNA binding protein